LLGNGASTCRSPSLAIPKVETPLAAPFTELKTNPTSIGPHNNTYGRAFLPSLVSRGEEEKNHLHLKLFGNFRGSTWCSSFKTEKPLKMQQTQEQNQNKNNTQIGKSTRVNANAEKFGIKFKLIAHYQQQPMHESHKQQELKLLKMHKFASN
jgi:hypothetical protein